MKKIRVVYFEKPTCEATEQHPDAERFELEVDGRHVFVDALGYSQDDPPTEDEVRAVLEGKP